MAELVTSSLKNMIDILWLDKLGKLGKQYIQLGTLGIKKVPFHFEIDCIRAQIFLNRKIRISRVSM